MKENYGKDAFRQPERCLSMFSDIAPSLKSERSMLERLLKHDIVKEFIDAAGRSKNDQQHAANLAISRLTKEEYIQEEIAGKYLNDLAAVFAWQIVPFKSDGKMPVSSSPVKKNTAEANQVIGDSILPKEEQTIDVDRVLKKGNQQQPQKNSDTMMILLVCLLLIAAGTAGVFFMTRPSNDQASSPSAVPSAAAAEKTPEASQTEAPVETQQTYDEITLRVSGTDSANRIVIEADGGQIDPLNYVTVDEGLHVSADPASVNTGAIGTVNVTYTVTSSGGRYGNNKKSFDQTFLIQDTQSPVIHLKESEIIVAKGKNYNYENNLESITDSNDNSFSYVSSTSSSGPAYTFTGNLNTNKAGVYTVTCSAWDSAGNKTAKDFTVRVQEQERFVAKPSGCTSKRTDYDTLFRELEQYGNEYTSPAYSTLDEMRMALKKFENEKYPNIPCQVYPGLHISDGETDQWIFYDYNPWDD